MDALILEREDKISDFSTLSIEKTPNYTTGSTDVENVYSGQNIYQIRENILYGLMTGVVMIYRTSNPAIRFKELASQVEEDCILLSSPSQIALHTSYQEIIGMGKKIVPFLIEKLDEIPTIWFWALESITGINPVPKNQKGNVPVMVEYWKNWFKENNYGKTKGFSH